MSVLFLAAEGGSFFVAALNLVIPGVQIVLTFLLFKPVRAAAIPALGKRLNRAMKSGNTVAAKVLWEEAGSTKGSIHRFDIRTNGIDISSPFHDGVNIPVSAPATLCLMSISCPRPAQVEIMDDDGMYDRLMRLTDAEIMDHSQLFAEMLPHLTFFLDVTKRCDFMSEELKDLVRYGTSISGSLQLILRKCCAC